MSSGGFLPPEPGGQGPDLTATPRAAEPPPAQAWPQPGWGHAPAEPDNGPAVIGFAFSISSIGLLVLSVSKPARTSSEAPPQSTACSPKRSVSVSSLNVVVKTPPRVQPMPLA